MKFFSGTLQPLSFFTGAAMLFAIIYNLVTPPLLAPDEFNHFYRAWQISQGELLPVREGQRLGGEIPYSVSDFALPYRLSSTSEHKPDSADIRLLFSERTILSETAFRDFPNTAYYSPVSYLPQTVAILLTSLFGAPVIVQYYAGRVFMLLIWILCGRAIIRSLPAYQWLFTMLMLTPMNLYLCNSFSADTVTNLLAFSLLAGVLSLAFRQGPLRLKELILLGLNCILLSQAKLVYVPLVLLVLVIPRANYGSKVRYLAFTVPVILLSFIAAYAWSYTAMQNYLSHYTYDPRFRELSTLGFAADYHIQKQYILNHTLYFPEVVLRSLFRPHQPYLASYIGFLGAYQDVLMHPFFYWLGWALLLVSLCTGRKLAFSAWQVTIMLLSALMSLVLLLLSQHLTWDMVGSGIVELMQGRYLTPLFPVLFVLLFNSWLPGPVYRGAAAVLFVLVLNAAAAGAVYKRYTFEPYALIESYRCDGEKLDPAGNFICTNDLVLQGNSNVSRLVKRSGKQSVISSPGYPYTLQHSFERVNGGDLVEIELWKKGEGMSLVLSGGSETCSDFYVANNKPDYTGAGGWEHIHMVYRIPVSCRNTVLHFMLHNPGKNIVYVDDLVITLKKNSHD